MEIQEMIKYIDEPFNMKEEDLSKMEEIIEKYPFFHTANLLYIKVAHNVKPELYDSVISKISATVPNREILHELINLKEIVVKEEKKVAKPKESKTRADIRKRIKERRTKRIIDKADSFKESGKARHLSLLKGFFEPIIEKLVKNIENYQVVIKNGVKPKVEDAKKELSVEEIRAQKKAEREKRMAEKRRLREQENNGVDDRAKRKAEREKRKAEREARMAKRVSGSTEELKVEKEVVAEKSEELTDREKRKIEREKRRAEKEKEIAKQIAENSEKEKTTDKVSEDKKEEVKSEIEIVVEKSEELTDREKRKIEREKRKAEKEKEIAKQIAENTEKEKTTDKVSEDKKEDNNKEIVENKKNDEIPKDIVDDPYTKIITIPSTPKEKTEVVEEKKTINKEARNVNSIKQKEIKQIEDSSETHAEIEDIFEKIISSKRKRPITRKTRTNDSLTTKKTIDKADETKNAKNEKVDEIEFIVEDTTDVKDIKISSEAKEIKLEEDEEIFEFIEKKDEEPVKDKVEKIDKKEEVTIDTKTSKQKKDEEKNTKDEQPTDAEKILIKKEEAEAKAAKSVLDRIAAYKNKKKTVVKDVVKKEDEKIEVKDELIEKFIKEKPSMKRPEVDDEKENENIAEESTVVKKPVITELMASIYVNQGKYNQAIEIYEQLILKNPEKKDYFALKIKETEKLK